jgi:hypothetical protein
MKTKNKVILTVLGVLTSSLFFIVAPTTANAGDCSAADPCGTWAVVEGGVVTNIIVCQPSVCGSGEFAGKQVVLQTPGNPVTHQSQGGYMGTREEPVTYNSEQKTFTQSDTTWSVPQINTEVVETVTATGALETATLTAVINPEGLKSNPATISATQGELNESKIFNESKTSVEVEIAIQDSVIMKKYLNKFLQLLRGWTIA